MTLSVAVATYELLGRGRLVAVGAARQHVDREGDLLIEARRRPEALGELYVLVERRLVRYFYRRTACAATAADLTSETFAAAIDGLRRFDPKKGAGIGWIFGIARHLHSQWLRSEQVEQAARRKVGMQLGPPEDLDVTAIEESVDFGPILDRLDEALEQLTAPTRDAVVLRIVERLDYEEISARLRCSPGAARVRVSRGLDQLGERLGVAWSNL